MNLWRTILFALLWQVGWFAAVIAGAHAHAWLGLLAAIPAVLVAGYGRWWRVVVVGMLSVTVGIGVDGALALSGVIGYAHPVWDGPVSPPWMWGLWLQLGLSLDICLGWLRRSPWLSVVFGAVGGPLAYFGGVTLQALMAPSGLEVLIGAVAVAYGVAMPVLVRLAGKGNA